FYAIGKSVVSFYKKYLNWVPGFFDKLKEAAPDIHTELEKAENEKLQKIEELEKSKESYLTKKDEINSKIQSLEQELSETTEGDLLKSFVQSRMGTDEYSKHLGIQAKIRDDFEKLSNLITEYNKSLEEESYETKDSEHLFNRIILYIDDLDRCPPEKVVEVLQAVHLLLSFPAFIVMVAVDSRWVSQSLRIGYKELFGDQLNIDSDGDGIPDYFRATPHDYLEKIFQIPFWLYPMNMEGRRSLITKLMESSMSSEEESPPAEEEHIEKAEIIGSYKNQGRNIFENEELLSEEHVKEIVQNEFSEEDFDYVAVTESVNLTAQLVIQKIELDFSIILSPILGQSPRALKRFVNVYLLVKVGLSELQWQIYFDKIHPKNGLKDEKNILRNFQSVMFLLAVITGMPSTSRIFFKSLRSKTNNTIYELLDSINVKRKPDGTWTIFGETMDSITSTKKASEQKQIDDEENNEIHNLNMQIEIMQFLKWLEFNRPKKDWGIVDIDQLRYWDPIVSKYSFRVEPFEQD
ncbi:MAG: hypothetical protein KDK36_00015, partial [Leptospiraceae bacterium]|nr:hypothetical protein [Leptospiraceae bacterium]